MNVAIINAGLRDAGEWLDKARAALGNGNKAEALYCLARALGNVKRGIKDVRAAGDEVA